MELQRTVKTEHADLAVTMHYPTKEGKGETLPLIVFCHGFTGSRIGADRLFVQAARYFSEAGYLAVRFDYGGCGESTGSYGDGGMEQLVKETRIMLDYTLSFDCVDLSRVTLVGHSLGGAVAVQTAFRDRRVKRLVLWAPVAHPLADIVRIIGPKAHREIISGGKTDYLGYTLTDRFLQSLADSHPLQETRQIRGDVLVLHGAEDEVITSDAAHLYQKAFWLRSDGMSDKEILTKADHSFTGQDTRNQLFELTADWLRIHDPRNGEWNHYVI
ncbi:MAG: permease [Paenibacillaceae bacterium]|jgi:pimeloyl-ACP methyl ester carboxylesterase|nr:permease [Paenibacillaceae bacterium]